MAIVTSIPTAKANLLTMLQGVALFTTNGVQVTWESRGVNASQECIFFLGTERQKEEAISLGIGTKHEHFTIQVVVSVATDGDDAQTNETAMWSYVQEIEKLIRPSPANAVNTSLQGAVTWALIGSMDHTPYAEPGQRIDECVVGVDCFTRK